MKILTNIQTSHLAGISQTFSSFLESAEKEHKRRFDITGVEIIANSKLDKPKRREKKKGKFTLISLESNFPNISEASRNSKNIQEIENTYVNLINIYQEIIKKERPDVILLNGTYLIPWCLFKASQGFNTPTVLHYHGILSKEVAHWEEKQRLLLGQMEKSFDQKGLYYLFPSNLAKEVVENEIYGHKIVNFSVLPNPVPKHFFQINKKGSSKNIGIVSRWAMVKNPSFIKRIVTYNQKHSNQFLLNIVTDLKKDSKVYKGISESVHFQEPMNNQRLADFYGKMGIIISPSVFETYGNVAQEALAANTPALVSSNMGVSETYRKLGLQDWIVDFNSVKNVYDKAKEISKQGVNPMVRKMIFDEYSPEKIHGQLLNILSSV
ncbi:MAG: glycosyltransferase [Candidatus Daviesbacteria bacterium]|nr:glycosyltransferase [Candidatus Daviesbacteria bacterium]